MEKNPFDILVDQIRAVVREEVKAALRDEIRLKEKPQPEPDWVRAEDLARKYNLPKTLFEEAGREGKIQRTKPGRHVLFNRRDVERYLQECGANNGTNH